MNPENRYPIEDDLLETEAHQSHTEEQSRKDMVSNILQLSPDIDGFPGLPRHCIPDVLMTWDFLCTFSRSLSLDSIGLDDFVAALTYRPSPDTVQQFNNNETVGSSGECPLYLAEVRGLEKSEKYEAWKRINILLDISFASAVAPFRFIVSCKRRTSH